MIRTVASNSPRLQALASAVRVLALHIGEAIIPVTVLPVVAISLITILRGHA